MQRRVIKSSWGSDAALASLVFYQSILVRYEYNLMQGYEFV